MKIVKKENKLKLLLLVILQIVVVSVVIVACKDDSPASYVTDYNAENALGWLGGDENTACFINFHTESDEYLLDQETGEQIMQASQYVDVYTTTGEVGHNYFVKPAYIKCNGVPMEILNASEVGGGIPGQYGYSQSTSSSTKKLPAEYNKPYLETVNLEMDLLGQDFSVTAKSFPRLHLTEWIPGKVFYFDPNDEKQDLVINYTGYSGADAWVVLGYPKYRIDKEVIDNGKIIFTHQELKKAWKNMPKNENDGCPIYIIRNEKTRQDVDGKRVIVNKKETFTSAFLVHIKE